MSLARMQGGYCMEQPFRIEKKEAFRVIGAVLHTTNQKKEGRKAVPEQWANFHKDNVQEKLMPLMNQEPYGLFGISVYNVDENDSRKFDNYIAVSSNVECDGFVSYEVPACTWAIFPSTMDTIGKTEVMAITKWLPKSNYKALNSGYISGRMKSQAPDIECFSANNEVEVWVAVKEK